ncbi:hypothetical protein Tco_0046827 [Tanacetum coccineum]
MSHLPRDILLVSVEVHSRHGPSDAMHNPPQPLKVDPHGFEDSYRDGVEALENQLLSVSLLICLGKRKKCRKDTIGNNVVPLRPDTIRLVQNGCSFHGLWAEDPNQHLKDFLKLVDSLDLDGENKERTRMRLLQCSLRDQASNWLERLPARSITTWEDLTTRTRIENEEMLRLRNLNQDPFVYLYDLKGSDEGDNKINSLTKEPSDTLLMGDEVISTIPERENDEFIKSSIDDLVPIPRESDVTSVCEDLECDMSVNTPFPTTDVREENFDINSPLGEYVVYFLMENINVAGLPRHLVKYLFNHLIKNPSLRKGMSDEPLGDDLKPRSYDVTFSNPLFDFNDDFTLCNDNPLFDEEFEDIRDAIIDIDLLLGEHLVILSTGDREIDFNPSRDIEELECLLADNPVPVPRVFDEPLGNSDSMSRSFETSELFEELIAEFGLDDSIPTEIDDRCHDSEGDILYFEQLLNEDTSFDVSLALLPTNSSSIDLPLPDPKQIYLREVERFDSFFSLTQSVGKTRVIETPYFSSYHIPSPLPTAYSPTKVMYCYYHPRLTSGDGFNRGPKMK